MKKYLLILTLTMGLILGACVPITELATETEVVNTKAPDVVVSNPTPTPKYLSDLYELTMFSAGEGWSTNLDKSRIYSTQNFGEHFLNVTPSGFEQYAGGSVYSYFSNSSTAWVCINQPGESGTLFTTSDAGRNWIQTSLDSPCGMMAFPSRQIGYLLASEDVGMGSQYMSLHKTEDGGITWSEVFKHTPGNPLQPGLPTSGIKSEFIGMEADTLLVGGSEPVPGSLYLYRSVDGGLSWSQVSCQGLPDAEEAEFAPTNITRINASEAFLAVQSFLPDQDATPTHFCFTSDAGETWNYLSSLDNVFFNDFGSALTGVAYADGKMYQSTDGGMTWSDVSQGLPPAITPVAVDMISDIVGYLTVSITPDTLEQNRIYLSVDGGKLWKAMPGTIFDFN